MDAKTVAETILAQLKAGDISRFLSWASSFVFGENSQECEMFLQFRCNGALFKGKIRIVLELARDTYRLEFYQGFELTHSVADVYAEDLAQIIDERVEKPACIKTRREYLDFLAERGEAFLA